MSRTRSDFSRKSLVTLATGLLAMLPAAAFAQIAFTDVTNGSGINYTGESYGASWGYVNDDKLPDLFVSHHREDAGLYVNKGNGTFENRAFAIDVWQEVPRSDQHGGAFADYNNDGFKDLLITAGSAYNSQFLVNSGGFMSDRILDFTFDVKTWGGRMPAWFDFTRDGMLDLAVAASGAEAIFQTHEQVNGDFLKRNWHTGHNCKNNDYGHLSDLTNDGMVEWICARHDVFPQYIYDYSAGLPFIDRTNLMQQLGSIVDSQFADFNGDLLMDMFAVTGRARVSGTEQTGNKTLETHLVNFNGAAIGFTFKTTGDVSFEMHTRERNAAHVFIGKNGKNPPYPGPETPITFTLSPNDSTNHGLVADFSSVNSDIGSFIGYNPNTQTWSFYDWSDSSSVLSYTYAYVSSTANITNLTQENLHPLDLPRAPVLLQQTSGTFTDVTDSANLNNPIACVSLAAADFDNDMDLDIYLACRNAVSNRANMVLENDGTGRFTVVPNAGGAAGPVGFSKGLSETVVVSDYDVDGFVDVFVTNGLKLYPELIGYSAGGTDKIFKNLGNSNHWIEIDLVGKGAGHTNRDGIGAIVTVTAGGVAQRREQNGGYHRWAQNDTRLHFGLAGNTKANIQVRWPSGVVDSYSNVSADELYTIVENTSITRVDNLDPAPEPDCQETVGQPNYDMNTDRAVFIWRENCLSNTWKVRLTGGPGPQITFSGRLNADQNLVNVTDVGLEYPWDELDNSNPKVLDFKLIVGDARQDGFDFTVAANSGGCFGVNSSIPSAFAGASRTPINLPFDLATGGPCSGQTPTVSIDNISVSEGISTGKARFTVRLSAQSAQNVTVQYATQNGTATAPADYASRSGTVTFSSGQTTKVIDIDLVDDSTEENTETFTVRLSSPVNANLGNATGTATILDNDSNSVPINNWTGHLGGVTTSGNQINYSGSPTGWNNNTVNSVRMSQFGFTSDYEVSWRLNSNPAGSNWVVGLGVTESSPDRTDVDYGLRSVNGDLQIRNNGLWEATGPSMSNGDVISIRVRSNNTLEFRHNAVLIHSRSFGGAPDFYIDTSFKAQSVSMSVSAANVVSGGGGGGGGGGSSSAITNWSGQTGGVTSNSDRISYSGSPTGWHNTINSASFASMGYNDNYVVSWRVASDASGNWIVGLGLGESGDDWRDVDYGWRTVDGGLRIFENGNYRETAGTAVSTGDILSISVSGTTLEYQHNGVPVYTRSIPGGQSFYIDTAFRNGAVTLADFEIMQF